MSPTPLLAEGGLDPSTQYIFAAPMRGPIYLISVQLLKTFACSDMSFCYVLSKNR
jgi:hypothetical protein